MVIYGDINNRKNKVKSNILLGFRIMISMTGSDPVGNGLIPLTPAN